MMIEFTKGNLLEANTEALVNTVNTVGVMGKGIALQFKNRFPNNYKIYRNACKEGTFKTGEVLVVEEGDLYDKKYIINFPTKAHWKQDSKYEYISSGLVALKEALKKYGIKSVAIPPLGCGNGCLDWEKVRTMIVDAFEHSDIQVVVFEPNSKIKEILQKENTKQSKVELTPARAMLLYLLFAYESRGEQVSLFVANKLAYFLQRSGEKLRLNFEAHHYGPYAVQLNHVLYRLNGIYLKGMEQNVAEPFESLYLNYDKFDEIKNYIEKYLTDDQRDRVQSVIQLIERFESAYALELLTSVDYLMHNQKSRSVEEILEGISNWSNRKANTFETDHIKLAVQHLSDHASESLSSV